MPANTPLRTLLALGLLRVTPSALLAQTVQPTTGTAQPPRIAIENAPAPLYDDPVWHGASDPAVVWMPGKGDKGEYWKGAYWDLQDNGRGLDSWRSDTGLDNWTPNAILLSNTSTRGAGHHPWIIKQDPASGSAPDDDKQLVLFYFTHDGNKTYMQMAEVKLGEDGKLACTPAPPK